MTHQQYRIMVACSDTLSVKKRSALEKHLVRCPECRDRATVYADHVAAIRQLRSEYPPGSLRQTVLAYAEMMPTIRRSRWSFLSAAVALRLTAVFIVLAAALVNTPLPRAVAHYLGGATPMGVDGVGCDQDGIARLSDGLVIASPADFNPGPHGVYNNATAREDASKLVHPIWYVLDGGPVATGVCGAAPTLDVEVGYNPDNHTELHVFGRLKPGAQP